jgi:molybdopterin synthase catalytic subunit
VFPPLAAIMPDAATDAIDVQVLLFARFAELLGTERLQLALPAGATVQSVLERLAALPGGAALPARPLVARNRAQATPATPLADGDEVAVLPPLSGG